MVAVAVGLFTVGPLRREGSQLAMGDAYSSNLSPDKYTLNPPVHDVDPDHDFYLDLDDGVDLKLDDTLPPVDDPYAAKLRSAAGAVRVFADGSLTEEIPCSVYQTTDSDGNRLMVSPSQLKASDTSAALGKDDDVFHVDTLEDHAFGRWYGFGGYYLVRYVGKDGKQLDKPEVTYFTVRDDVTADENRLDAPQNVSFSVEDNGGLGISWDAVEGAQGYKVYLKSVDPTETNPTRAVTLTLLGTTTDTKMNTADYDAMAKAQGNFSASNTDLYGSAGSNYYQNNQFKDLVIGDDEDRILGNREDTKKGQQGLEVADYAPTRDKVKDASITVVATGAGADQQSPFLFKGINDLLGQLPIEQTTYIQGAWSQQAKELKGDPKKYLANRLVTYVTMADGTAASVINVLDTTQVKSRTANLITGEDENDPSTWQRRSVEMLQIPYKVKNTMLTGYVELEASWFPGGAAEIDKAANDALQAMYKANPAAGLPQRAHIDSDVDWNAIQASRKPATEPADVPYPVNGSSDYVKFVASNIMAGNMYLDVTKYASQPGAPGFDDVLGEALGQNPMTLLDPAYVDTNETTKDGHTYVAINSIVEAENNDAGALNDTRAKTYEQVKQIVAGAVKDGMSDADKVKALDAALAKRLAYDYDMFYMSEGQIDKISQGSDLGAFDSRGYAASELLDKNLVLCCGYAKIFKACADEAGLKSVYVTGTVPATAGLPNNGHAWNLVSIDGKWKVVDVTWDDAGDTSDGKYLLLDQTDAKLAGRAYTSSALLDSAIDDYVDPSLMAA